MSEQQEPDSKITSKQKQELIKEQRKSIVRPVSMTVDGVTVHGHSKSHCKRLLSVMGIKRSESVKQI